MGPMAESFPPIAARGARVLVLGSMPGEASLRAQEYYAYKHNAFWGIVEALFDIRRELTYAERTAQLAGVGVALWDVLAACRREGSLDADIEADSVVPNDIGGFLEEFPTVRALCFNGRESRKVFDRHVVSAWPEELRARVTLHDLPSTSPAYAAMSKEAKRERWSIVRELAGA